MWPFRHGGWFGLGRKGERLVTRHLKRGGLKILARNYRCPSGEVDLIALDSSTLASTGAETIAFVEVKTRSCDRYTAPAGAVDAEKRRRITKAANYYIAARQAQNFNVRFDIVAVVMPADGRPRVEHIPQAF